ncbi:unnamed protein product [Ilex paraguariensis]|uniref:Uncharacterized protein n=1 Tax=Ilex paraguariensis TaxID=185542 RepID=A0ABC8SZK3_9AQUA
MMSGRVSLSSPPQSSTYSPRIVSKTHNSPSWSSSASSIPWKSRDHPLCSSDLKLKVPPSRFGAGVFPERIDLRCNSSTGPGGPGESDSRGVLDAFFLGKALAEVLNERIESSVGEILSAVGRLQGEQQKQIQDFQEEVLEKAKRAKEEAAREAVEAQRPVLKSSTANVSTVANVVSSTTAESATDAVTPELLSSPSNSTVQSTDLGEGPTYEDPLLGVTIED